MQLTTICLAVLGSAATLFAAPALAAEPEQPPVEVMVLGTWHFANPGADLHNAKSDDMTSPRRQAELEDLARRLARFRPTKIMVEEEPTTADQTVARYADFTPAVLKTKRNETEQIAFRLAHRLGHRAVYAFDEQPGPGEPDYFPFDKIMAYAEANGRTEWLQGLHAPVAAATKRFEEAQKTSTVAELLAVKNTRAADDAMHRGGYYELLKLGDAMDQPGAELNALWYMRNAKMFAKLTKAAAPGDRVLVVVGSGHGYWLRHFAENTPGYRLADPLPYLQGAR